MYANLVSHLVIFEGVLEYDVALYLKYFIKKKKRLTYSDLNRCIKQFKYKGSDTNKSSTLRCPDFPVRPFRSGIA